MLSHHHRLWMNWQKFVKRGSGPMDTNLPTISRLGDTFVKWPRDSIIDGHPPHLKSGLIYDWSGLIIAAIFYAAAKSTTPNSKLRSLAELEGCRTLVESISVGGRHAEDLS